MPAIAPNLALALCLFVPDSSVSALLLKLSAALEDGSAVRFLAQFNRQAFARYAELEDNLVAMLAQNEAGSSVKIAEEKCDGETCVLGLDWLLQLQRRGGLGGVEQRRELVRCRLQRRDRGWRVTALEPIEFFRPLGRPPA